MPLVFSLLLICGLSWGFVRFCQWMEGDYPKPAKKGFEGDSRGMKNRIWLQIKANWDELAEAELEAMNSEIKAKLLTRKLIAQKEINRLTDVLVDHEKRNREKLKEVGLNSEDQLL